MNDFLKASGLIMIAVILCLVLSEQNKHFSMLLSMAVCLMVALAAMIYLEPVIDFFATLQSTANWNNALFTILLKASGIGIIMQIVSMLCVDYGNTALGKSIQFLGTAVVLWLSLPLFTELILLINELLSTI